MRTLLISLLFPLSLFGQSTHSGKILFFDLPGSALVTVYAEGHGRIEHDFEQTRDGRVVSWTWTNPCVVILVEPVGEYFYDLYLGDTLNSQRRTRQIVETCPTPGEWSIEVDDAPVNHHIYPNPTTGHLYSDGGGRWNIYDSNDRLVEYNYPLPGSIDHLPDGTYFIIQNRKVNRHKQKIIKKTCCN